MLYSNSGAYDEKECHGNIFRASIEDLKHSEGYIRAVSEARKRINLTCTSCRYHGSCTGYFMGEATPEERYTNDDGNLICAVVQPLQRYIEKKLVNLGLVNQQREHLLWDKAASRIDQTSNPALTSY
jgi:uncharacterized protein